MRCGWSQVCQNNYWKSRLLEQSWLAQWQSRPGTNSEHCLVGASRVAPSMSVCIRTAWIEWNVWPSIPRFRTPDLWTRILECIGHPSIFFFGLRSKFLNLILCQILLQWLSKGFEVTLGHKLDLFVASPGLFGRFALFDPKKYWNMFLVTRRKRFGDWK